MRIVNFIGEMGSGKTFQAMKAAQTFKSQGRSVLLISWADTIKQILEEVYGLTKTGPVNQYVFENLHNMNQEECSIRLQKEFYKIMNTFTHFKNFHTLDWQSLTGKIYDLIHKCIVEDYTVNYRKLIQLTGTEIGRAIDKDFWVTVTLNKIKNIEKTINVVIFDDTRFENELCLLREFCDKNNHIYENYGVVASDEVRAKRLNITLKEVNDLRSHTSENYINKIIDKISKEYIIVNN